MNFCYRRPVGSRLQGMIIIQHLMPSLFGRCGTPVSSAISCFSPIALPWPGNDGKPSSNFSSSKKSRRMVAWAWRTARWWSICSLPSPNRGRIWIALSFISCLFWRWPWISSSSSSNPALGWVSGVDKIHFCHIAGVFLRNCIIFYRSWPLFFWIISFISVS